MRETRHDRRLLDELNGTARSRPRALWNRLGDLLLSTHESPDQKKRRLLKEALGDEKPRVRPDPETASSAAVVQPAEQLPDAVSDSLPSSAPIVYIDDLASDGRPIKVERPAHWPEPTERN